MKFFKDYFIEIVLFISGAVVMILEIIGSRVLAPYMGASTFVWTSLIAVVLGSLCVGYVKGGKLADKTNDLQTLSKIVFYSGICVLAMNIFKGPLLTNISKLHLDLRLSTFIASTILFAPPSIFFGMIPPYGIRLKINKVKNSGTTVGNLYAISTMGSIFGTIFAGFFLISFLGTTKILYTLAIIQIIISIFAHANEKRRKILMLLLIFLCVYVENGKTKYLKERGVIDIDSKYSRIRIFNTKDPRSEKEIKVMQLNKQFASAMYLNSDDMVFRYTPFYDLAHFFNPDIKTALLIGGAGYSYPKKFVTEYPNASMDVVEIDPMVTKLAREHFKLSDFNNMTIYHEDGRTFLNNTNKKYDVIFMDAFNTQLSIPTHLTTKEAVKKIYESLNDRGVYATNLISAISGEKSKFLTAEYATYKLIFPHVLVFQTEKIAPNEAQNLVLIALKSKAVILKSDNPKYITTLDFLWTENLENGVILTDEYAPVESFLQKLL